MNFIINLYKNEPVLFHAGLVIIGVFINYFLLPMNGELALAVDAFLVALAGAASRHEVTPVAKLRAAGLEENPPKVQ